MKVEVDGQPVVQSEFAVCDLGFGRPIVNRPKVLFRGTLDRSEFVQAMGDKLKFMIDESVEEYAQGILESDYHWIVSGWTGHTIAQEAATNADYLLRIVSELMDQEFLMAVLDGGDTNRKFVYVANSLSYVHLDGDQIAFGGEAFLAESPVVQV